jgi:type I restriction enzyme M protein
MIETITKRTPYGEVLEEDIKLKNPKTFHNIIKSLSSVSFYDCSLDSKGAAFEYFVRATLKGKKLGQYFTPRELVQVMLALIGRKKIINSIISNSKLKVLDPACGTGGFLVHLMQNSIEQLDEMLKARDITKGTYDNSVKTIKESTFFGSDANEGVAASAKMNMIIAGDGHTNIQHEDSLSINAKNWNITTPNCDLILTNPPFGTSESDSLTSKDISQFDVSTTKGQYLFIQKMIKSTVSGGEICTVIDEGVLNTDSGRFLRKYILQQCKLVAVVNLPYETFKPNKINVKCSLLYLVKREVPDIDFEDDYKVTVCQLNSLGYYGSGEKIRDFKMSTFLDQIAKEVLDQSKSSERSGYNWIAYDIAINNLHKDATYRFDYKYWDLEKRKQIDSLVDLKNPRISEINLINTRRGKSPSADSYVDEIDGYALVVKAGSSISKLGTIISDNSDWIEKSIYDEFLEKEKETKTNINIIKKGDVLLSSTGEGTLGKCSVYNLSTPAIADGHVTIIRVDKKKIDPFYLADYLRKGFGASQVIRLFTGSTGLIELTPDQVNSIVVDQKNNLAEQKELSKSLRSLENKYSKKLKEADELLDESLNII